MREASTIEGVFAFDRLIGVPSYHYDPAFGRIAARAIDELKPSVVALELPPGLESELAWAASCWPTPVVSQSSSSLFPFVPGDSLFEAYRSAREAGIAVELVDLPCEEPPSRQRIRLAHVPMGPEWASKAPHLFLAAADAVAASAPTPARHLAREAHMARQLEQLLARGGRVLWVGGMAHWTRLRTRLAHGDFDGPRIEPVGHSIVRRMRLAPSALHRMTGRLPWLVERYARDPAEYDEHEALQALALDACTEPDGGFVLSTSGNRDFRLEEADGEERPSPADLGRMFLYARNLAASAGFRERPDLVELLTSAAGTIGPRYAGRLYMLAMREAPPSDALAALEWEVVKRRERYRCGDEIIDSRPWRAAQGGLALSFVEIRRRANDDLYKDLPPAGKSGKGKSYWEGAPDDEAGYVSFVEYLLRRASYADPDDATAAPFQNGLRDGVDVRATLRNWTRDTIYVREEQRGRLKITNGAIDWTNASEDSDILRGRTKGGWIDPGLTRLGSCSRTVREREILSEDPFAQRSHREFSLLTLDLPTSRRSGKKAPTFYDRVIKRLLLLQDSSLDNLHEWLEVMFKFCERKPFAYYSRYVPSAQIHRIAAKHGVRVIHFPLQRLPATLVARHTSFRFFAFTRRQWLEFERRRSAARGTWGK